MVMFEIAVLALAGIICIMGALLHSAWGEIEELCKELDEAREECDELDRLAAKYKSKAHLYELIYHESEFAHMCKQIG